MGVTRFPLYRSNEPVAYIKFISIHLFHSRGQSPPLSWFYPLFSAVELSSSFISSPLYLSSAHAWLSSSNRDTHAPLTLKTITQNSIIHANRLPEISHHTSEHTHTYPRPSDMPIKPQAKSKKNCAKEILGFLLNNTLRFIANPHHLHPHRATSLASPPAPLALGGIKFKFKCPHSAIHLSLSAPVMMPASLVELSYLSLSDVRAWFKLWHFSGRVTDCP